MTQLLDNTWFVAIAGGLIVSLAWAVISYLSHGFVRQVMAKSTDLSGEWDQFDVFPPSGEPVGVWKIRQVGSRIWAHLSRVTDREGSGIQRSFVYRGQWIADQLTATFHDTSGKHRTGAVVLRWVSSKEPCVLAGKTVYWDRTPSRQSVERMDPDGISAFAYSLRKRKVIA